MQRAMERQSNITINVHIKDKVVAVCCGEGSQRISWLGHVGIARYDEASHRGWEILGVPTAIELQDGTPLDLGAVIRETLADEQHVVVTPSISAK
jgi:N-terminal of Par3 and HAL proteins